MASKLLAEILRIEGNIIDIEGKDRIVLATKIGGGFNAIVEKNTYLHGDLVIFIYPDVEVDTSKYPFTNLNKNIKNKWKKISCIKINDIISEGLVLPLHILNDKTNNLLVLNENTDVSHLLPIRKYTKDNNINTNSSIDNNYNKNKYGPFPTNIIKKTDEYHAKTKLVYYEKLFNQKVYISAKMDGSSMTLIYNRDIDELKIYSRNNELLNNEFNINDNMIKYFNNILIDKLDIKNKLKLFNKNIAIQGEFVGPKINNNNYSLKSLDYYIFTIKYIDENRYCNYDEIINICNILNLKMVPILKVYDNYSLSLDNIIEYVNNLKINDCDEIKNNSNHIENIGLEGIVIRPTKTVFDYYLKRILSFKILNINYKNY